VTKAVQCLSKLQPAYHVGRRLRFKGDKGRAMPFKIATRKHKLRLYGQHYVTKAVQCLTKLQDERAISNVFQNCNKDVNMPTKKPRKQCTHCPWRVDVDPHEIPNGYCPTKHAGLKRTIAQDAHLMRGLHVFVCHETTKLPCVGWLHNQLGAGNNITLRVAVIEGRVNANYKTVGEQHETFEDTLPEPQNGHGHDRNTNNNDS